MKYLKFRMPTKEKAYEIKQVIIERAKNLGLATLNDIRSICLKDPELDGEGDRLGWKYSDLNGSNIKVMMCKMGEPEKHAYLYICEPTLPIRMLNGENETSLLDYIYEMAGDGYMKCIVTHKKGKKTVERKALGLFWTDNYICDKGNYIKQDLIMCVFNDGHFERIDYKNVRFVKEW